MARAAAATTTKRINFANMKYISPTPDNGGGIRHLRGKLRYYQYRNDKSDHIPHARNKPPRRWVDHGLGSNYGEILKACQELQSEYHLAWTWVISPTPALMALVPEEMKRDLLHDLTETVVEKYYEARGVDVPDYSYVMHDRDTVDGEQQLHTHIVLPGTVQTVDGPQPFYNNESKGHFDLFNGIADQEFAVALDRTIGLEWRALLPTPETILAS